MWIVYTILALFNISIARTNYHANFDRNFFSLLFILFGQLAVSRFVIKYNIPSSQALIGNFVVFLIGFMYVFRSFFIGLFASIIVFAILNHIRKSRMKGY